MAVKNMMPSAASASLAGYRHCGQRECAEHEPEALRYLGMPVDSIRLAAGYLLVALLGRFCANPI